MSYAQRSREQFREDLRKSFTYDDIRLMDSRALARNVDAKVVEKTRLSIYGSQSDQIKRMTHRTEDYNDMQKARDTNTWGTLDARMFELEDNIPQIYYETYGQGFYGEPFPSKDGEWICPKCGLKYKMSLKTLPYECERCREITPMGELARDGTMRR